RHPTHTPFPYTTLFRSAAFAGFESPVERGEQHDEREPRGDVVAVRAVRAERRPVGPADERLEARHRRADVPVAGEAAVRAGLPRSEEHTSELQSLAYLV